MEQPDYGSLTEYFEIDGQSVYFSIHPEMSPYKNSILATGRYFVFCIHPTHGSCYFIVSQDKHRKWYSDNHPLFIEQHFIEWIGERIDFKANEV